MNETDSKQWTAFDGPKCVRSGSPASVALAAKKLIETEGQASVIVFDEASRVIDLDLRGTDADVLARLGTNTTSPAADVDAMAAASDLTPRGRGRPKLGVVAREVTLLPRHWDWLSTQPGGASAAVRRLVDAARQSNVEKDRRRQAKECAYRFISAMAGNEPGFEEGTRALFAGNAARFTELTDGWPPDVRDHARALAARAFA
jgi:hypothetical protein